MVDGTAYFCDRTLHALDIDAGAFPREVEPQVRCSVLEDLGDGSGLAAISDEHSAERPTLHLLSLAEPLAPSEISSVTLIEEGRGEPFSVAEDLVLSADTGVLLVAGWSSEEKRVIGHLDVGAPSDIGQRWTEIAEVVPMSVADHDGRVIVAAAANGLYPLGIFDALAQDLLQALGSAVVVVPTASSSEPTQRLSGPGGALYGLASHEDRA